MRKAKKINPIVWRLGFNKFWNNANISYLKKNVTILSNITKIDLFLLKYLNTKFTSTSSNYQLIDCKTYVNPLDSSEFICNVYYGGSTYGSVLLDKFFRSKKYGFWRWFFILKKTRYNLFFRSKKYRSSRFSLKPRHWRAAIRLSTRNFSIYKKSKTFNIVKNFRTILKGNLFYLKPYFRSLRYKNIKKFLTKIKRWKKRRFRILSRRIPKFRRWYKYPIYWKFLLMRLFCLLSVFKLFWVSFIKYRPLLINHINQHLFFDLSSRGKYFFYRRNRKFLKRNRKLKYMWYVLPYKNFDYRRFFIARIHKAKAGLIPWTGLLSTRENGYIMFITIKNYLRWLRRWKYSRKKYKFKKRKHKRYSPSAWRRRVRRRFKKIDRFFILHKFKHYAFNNDSKSLFYPYTHKSYSKNTKLLTLNFNKNYLGNFILSQNNLLRYSKFSLFSWFQNNWEKEIELLFQNILGKRIKFNFVNVLDFKNNLYYNFISARKPLVILSKILINNFYLFKRVHQRLRKTQLFIFFEILLFAFMTDNYNLAFTLYCRIMGLTRKQSHNFSLIKDLTYQILKFLGKNPTMQIMLTGRMNGRRRRTSWKASYNLIHPPLQSLNLNIDYSLCEFNTFASSVSIKIWRYK